MWPLYFLAVLIAVSTISIVWTNFLGAPWVPTSLSKVRKMLDLAEVGPNDVVYDLGCGDGRTIVTAAWRYGSRAVGIEIDPLRYLWCQMLITIMGLRGRVKVVYGNFFDQDLSGADVVTCYLLPNTNKKLESKFMSELHPNTRVVSNDFKFPGLHLLRTDDEANIFLYHPVPQ
jgi:16S rRNA A1518/A1519 N6-dimethyltransferase RsmA/KsgA/DIM1 with predicted DNA glycosylase/AP lyase activity